jgi:hypothetical protein
MTTTNEKNQPKTFETDEQKRQKVFEKEQTIINQGANGQWKPKWQTPQELEIECQTYSQIGEIETYEAFEWGFNHWQNAVRNRLTDKKVFLWRHTNMPKSEYNQVFNALKVSGWTIEAVPNANGTQTYVKALSTQSVCA